MGILGKKVHYVLVKSVGVHKMRRDIYQCKGWFLFDLYNSEMRYKETIMQYIFFPFLKNKGLSEVLSSRCRILLFFIEMGKFFVTNYQILVFTQPEWSSVL